MTILAEPRHVIRPWVCWWVVNGRTCKRRTLYESTARALQLIHNRDKPEFAEVSFDPEGTTFPIV